MPIKLSEMPMLYQPGCDPKELKCDLEMFSNPEHYEQDDDVLRAVKAEIQAILDLTSGRSADQTLGYLHSLLEDGAEVNEALSYRK